MPSANANGVELEYDTFGDPAGAPLLLIGGLGVQMIGWDEEFCELLASRGFRVIRYDNRDVGLSTWMDGGAGYTLDDMAADAVGLLDALGIPAAHIAGASMGGFIAQLVALNHPERVLTLTSMISGPNGEDQVQPTPQAMALLMTPVPETRQARIDLGLRSKKELLGPADPFDESYERARVARAIDRAYHPAGFVRQLQAIGAASSRVSRLAELRVPTLVVHGDADILVPVENGRLVAAAIPGARLLEIPGMGHDIPQHVWPQVVDEIAELAREAAASRA
ncbi:MAG TPA: alpha/beta fold hydrolase [Candidatus Dormibacteraeota bacterium]|nr:alpha/beta fold hydrolase [Candidatus Dormibacteraeota bacterium]